MASASSRTSRLPREHRRSMSRPPARADIIIAHCRAVVIHLCLQLGECAAVLVEDDGGGFVAGAAAHQPTRDGTSPGRRLREQGVPTSSAGSNPPIRSNNARRNAMLAPVPNSPAPRIVPPVLGRPDEDPHRLPAANEAAPEPAEPLEQLLRGRFDLERQDEPVRAPRSGSSWKARTIACAHPSSTTTSSSVNAMTSDVVSAIARLRAWSSPGRGSRTYSNPAYESATRRAEASVEGALSTTSTRTPDGTERSASRHRAS